MAVSNAKNKTEEVSNEKPGRWLGLVRATGSPLKLFALIVLICNSAFGVAASIAFNATVFIYTLHTFLFVVAAFVLIALWSPRSFYPPNELAILIELEIQNPEYKTHFPPAKPIIPSLILGAFVILYSLYQIYESS